VLNRPPFDEPGLPASPADLQVRLKQLADERRVWHKENRRPRRRSLSAAERSMILEKTDGLCHICGGKIVSMTADHVLAHSTGAGESTADRFRNYLPAHGLCNNYRWDYSQEEFQWKSRRLGADRLAGE
jgi:5-methylcytosine-specific restriction endonuclease McrA